MSEAQPVAPQSVAGDGDPFASLLQKQFKPKTDGARVEVERAVRTLAEQALRETAVVSDDVVGTIKAIIAIITTVIPTPIPTSSPIPLAPPL